jgi:hypothetical protein
MIADKPTSDTTFNWTDGSDNKKYRPPMEFNDHKNRNYARIAGRMGQFKLRNSEGSNTFPFWCKKGRIGKYTGCFQKYVPVKPPGTRFRARNCISEPGPQDPYKLVIRLSA